MVFRSKSVWVVSKTEGWGKAWKHTVNGAKLLFKLFALTVKTYFNTIVNGIMIGINKIKAGWYEFKNAVGMGDKADNDSALAKIQADTDARKKAIIDQAKEVVKTALKAKEEFAKAKKKILN